MEGTLGGKLGCTAGGGWFAAEVRSETGGLEGRGGRVRQRGPEGVWGGEG